MRPPTIHIPGEPSSEQPPEELLKVVDTFSHPMVHHSALTCDAEGNWALLLAVPGSTSVPVKELEEAYPGIRIVYEAQPEQPLQPFDE